MSTRENALYYAKNNYEAFLSNLESFIRIPSISTSSENVVWVRTAANFVEKLLNSIGVADTKILETNGHPVVFGHYKTDTPNAPTVL
ncbi:MAG: M20 family dipeptidase, partial [Anaerolineaceae bacterium]|nr:M20 family dipeptidase [Anaerolineaceae bacterium]